VREEAVKHHEYDPAPVDLRHTVDEEIIGEVTFMPDPFEAEQLRRRKLGRMNLSYLGGRKKAHGKAAHKAHVLYRETGMWVR
jgi:hypothetical protein